MRIVSLLPSATEILFAIGAGPDVVGVTHECDFPVEARALPRLTSSALPVGASPAQTDRHVRESVHAGSSLYHLDGERLESLAPDLIVTQELCAVCAVSYAIVARAARRLTHDPRIVSLEPSSLADVFATIAFLGEITGHVREAADVIEALQQRVSALGESTRKRKPVRTLLLEWTDPPMGGGHWTPEIVELAGGIPLLGNPGANSQTLDWDQIAQAQPEAVVIVPCGYDELRSQQAARELEHHPVYTTLSAFRNGRVYAMDGNAFVSRPGPRLVESAEMIARFLHGGEGH